MEIIKNYVVNYRLQLNYLIYLVEPSYMGQITTETTARFLFSEELDSTALDAVNDVIEDFEDEWFLLPTEL